jgi:hypothetical protein
VGEVNCPARIASACHSFLFNLFLLCIRRQFDRLLPVFKALCEWRERVSTQIQFQATLRILPGRVVAVPDGKSAAGPALNPEALLAWQYH